MAADPGTYGTPDQVRLQIKSLRMREEIDVTPGLSHTGRLIGSDDPDAVGWNVLEAHLKEDGFVGFRAMPPVQAEAVRLWGKTRGGIHEWAVLLGDAETLRAAAMPIMQRTLAEGCRDVSPEEMASDTRLTQMQTLMEGAGVAPLARTSLRGDIFPSACRGISGPDGMLVAVSNAAMQFNRFSRWHDTAWIGLVAVASEFRGLGLGARATAAAALAAVEVLGAARAMAFVADDNAPSRAMLLGIGMQPSPYRSIAVGQRFTR